MSYVTKNEFEQFDFSEAQIADVEVLTDSFHFCLDNVHILPENSMNRDIRTMRCNGLILRLTPMKIKTMVQEGYRTYNADGKLMREDPDLPVEDLAAVLAVMPEAYVVSFKKEGNAYTLIFDGNDEHSYDLVIESEGDSEEWERFLNL